MSLIIERLRQAGDSRQKDVEKSADDYTSEGVANGAVTLSRGVWVAMTVGFGIAVVLGTVLAVTNLMSRKTLSQEMAKVLRTQNEHIRDLSQKISSLEGRQKLFLQNVESKLNTVNDQLVRNDRRFGDLSAAFNSEREDLKNLRIFTQNMRDKYADLSSELKTLKLLTVKESALVVIPERKNNGKNN